MMKLTKNIEQLIKKNRFEASRETYDRTLQSFMQAVDEDRQQESHAMTLVIWRILMNTPAVKLGLAAIVLAVIGVSTTLWDTSATSVYAIDHTISAIQTIRTLHMRATGNENGMDEREYAESWINYDATGRMTNLRVDVYEGYTDEGDEARYHVVWNNGVQKIWRPLQNKLFIYRVNDAEEKVQGLLDRYDPRFMQRELHDAIRNKEQYDVTIDGSEQEDSIYVEVLDRDSKSRLELLVDPDTKLVTHLDEYHLNEEGGKLSMRIEFLAYNHPIDPELFELNSIPSDVLVIDKAPELVGIKREAMSTHEVAAEVVRQCLEATIAEDYDKVRKLMEGKPGDTIRNFIEEELGTRLTRVVSMGQPRPFGSWQHILHVPCEIEVENGAGIRWPVNIITMARSIDYQSGNRWVMLDEQLQIDGPEHVVNEILGSFAGGGIVPDVCVGDYLLGMSKDDVLASRGNQPEFAYGGEGFDPNNLPDTYYIAYRDLWFFIQDGSVTGILIKRPLYRFANGLKIGDSKEDIIQTFGHDFVFIDSGVEYTLTYRDKGLSFGLNKDNNAIIGIEVYSSPFLIDLYRQVSIGGTWQDSCQQVVQDGEVKNQRTTFNYSGETVRIERIDYQDNSGSTKSSSLVFTGTYVIHRMSTTLPGVKDIDYTVKSITVTFHTMAAVNKANQMKYLGCSDWQVDVTRDITGAPGTSSTGDRLYDIFRIDESNKLYIGSNEGIGSSSRPTSLRPFCAIKQ